tara:strand:+ start:1367 stop:1585 length:219 start_codon:yes stop_codon:yes gene_type:complete
MSNPLEQLLKDNWKSIQNCTTPIDQVMLSVDMVYQQELKNCKPNEIVSISIKKVDGNLVVHGKCVPKTNPKK